MLEARYVSLPSTNVEVKIVLPVPFCTCLLKHSFAASEFCCASPRALSDSSCIRVWSVIQFTSQGLASIIREGLFKVRRTRGHVCPSISNDDALSIQRPRRKTHSVHS